MWGGAAKSIFALHLAGEAVLSVTRPITNPAGVGDELAAFTRPVDMAIRTPMSCAPYLGPAHLRIIVPITSAPDLYPLPSQGRECGARVRE